ncbi:MAG TPA: hypothetical protein VIX73_05305 [Kofleriaceae bacterium]
MFGAAAARGTIARINRGLPPASLDMIDTPSAVAARSVGLIIEPGTGLPGSPGPPGSLTSGLSVEHAAQAAASSSEETARVRELRSMR